VINEGARWSSTGLRAAEKNGRSIDDTVKARLTTEKLLSFAGSGRWTLARRTALDIAGLPPTTEDVEAFVKDNSPMLTNVGWITCSPLRLMANDGRGLAWTWRATPTAKGYEKDAIRDMGWCWYRDWVIDAFNRDMPYDQFLTSTCR